MTGVYKLIFDLSVYYSLIGFYANLAFGSAPSMLGFALLCVVVGAYTFLAGKGADERVRMAVLALPFIALIFWPGIWPAIHLLPAWFYTGWSLVTGKTETIYEEFRSHFSFGFGIQAFILPAFLFAKAAPSAFVDAVPYLTLLLSSGVCLLRMLREETKSGTKQALFIMSFVAGCAILTIGRAPHMVMAVIKFLYQNVIAVAILCTVLTIGVVFFALFRFIFWLIGLLGGKNENPPEMNLMSAAEMMGLEEEFVDTSGDIAWLRILGYVLITAVIILLLFLLFRKLLGHGSREKKRDPWTDQRESVEPGARRRRRSLTRPRDPRLAVRYYYGRFMDECRKRGMTVKPSLTNEELTHASRMYFPGGDPGKLAEVYAPARYCERGTVTPADVDRAQAAWSRLKKTKAPLD